MTDTDSIFCASRSVRNRDWKARELPYVLPPEGVDPVAARIAAARGAADLDSYFFPNFRSSMPDPFLLDGMENATKRIWKAVQGNESIAILGDYDVDGASSTAMLVRLLNMAGHSGKIKWSIPDRMIDGYGPNERLIDEVKAESEATLLILLDSGTAAIKPVHHARGAGMDVVIIDHHEPQAERPDAILVNPKCQDDRTLDGLCTAGLVFLLAVALRRHARSSEGRTDFPDIRSLLGLAALATVADVVPLTGLNRAYVSLGVPRIVDIPGLKVLMEVTGETEPTVHGCGFVLAPCINAAGRIGTMHDGVRLLLTDSVDECKDIANSLHATNLERRDMQKRALEEALAAVDSEAKAIILQNPSWHPGIVGLIASKLREVYDRPAIIIGEHGKGSARTVEGFDIGSVIIEAAAKGLLLKGGGHKAAAGLTMDPAKFDDFSHFVLEAISDFEHPSFTADLIITPGEMTVETALALKSMEPFGQGNPKPRIAVIGGTCIRTSILKQAHIKITVEGSSGIMEAIAFNAVETQIGKAMLSSEGRRIDLYGTIEVSYWAGTTTVSIKPEDVMIGPELSVAAA